MRACVRLGSVAVAALCAVASVALRPVPLAAQEGEPPGKATYDRWCAVCHGTEGQGDGPAAGYMLPRPRDFTLALYQIRSTASGQIPTDADILRVIDEGMPGTTMPGWREILSDRERRELVDYLKSFSRFFAQGEAEALQFGRAPRASDEALAEGREFYERIECYTCHGDAGRGDGSSAPTLEDDLDHPIRAADLTANWTFNGGGSVEEIFHRLRTGLDGTPMPSFSDLLDADFMTEEQLWNVAHYVRSLAPADPPVIREVVSAALIDPESTLPSQVDDPAWDDAERFYVPLVGQIMVTPRWFDPRVEAVWVEALHDGSELAVRVSWTDPSRSPDPRWGEWKTAVLEAMAPDEGDPVDPGASHPDRLAVQFPTEIPEGMVRPYFLMGDGRTPVYLWQWSSDEGATEALARGMASVSPLDASGGEGALAHEAVWEDGQWRVVFRRPLASAHAEGLTFEVGRAVPIAFSAWDGDHGETGTRRAVSSWYFVYLEEPRPATVFVAPLLATLLTAGLGLLVVTSAQKRERTAGSRTTDNS